MARRTVTALLWLYAVWTAFGALSVYAGLPAFVGPAAGLLAAALIWWDPRGWIWKPVASAATRRRIADLQRMSAPVPSAKPRHETGTAGS